MTAVQVLVIIICAAVIGLALSLFVRSMRKMVRGSCCEGCSGCNADPRAEVAALMKYMVNHNTAHAGELAQLAGKLRDMGDNAAYEQVMQAVSDFEKGNMRLSMILAAMNVPQ